jgi:short-subunit dehydrogenase
MAKTILVCGYGPGISNAVAERFGREGFSVGLVARNEERLGAGVKALEGHGVRTFPFVADLADVEGLKALFANARDKLGAIRILHWNAAQGSSARDLLSADTAALRDVFELPVVCLMRAVQEVLPDLRSDKESALLVTNGGLGLFDTQLDQAAVSLNSMELAVANAAKHKLVRLLFEKLKPEGIYVGEAMVVAQVKGTAWDKGTATLEASTVAERFWSLYQARQEMSALVR